MFKCCNVLNPATLLPTPEEGNPLDCVTELSVSCSPRPDLMDQPLINPDLVLFVDGSASRDLDTGRCKAGYAVCDSRGTVESASLPSNYSAQAAELVALTRACHLAANQSVTIFTESRYAFGVVHDFGALWKHRGLLKSDGTPILNHRLVAALLDAVLLPSQVAICKCTAYTNLSDPISAEIRTRVRAALPSPADQQLHPLHPGDYVVIKDFRRTRWNQKRWQGPFQILLVTQTAVKVAERATWNHASHCKKVPEPKEPVSRE
ncbi:uncharacterized protein [Takifugu rubripes]|uniref:uncharacterized protein n=1 Tax=Takifugu rubripes TaxID=31033 RepID=UPI0011455E6C|nr:uncharacterized protein LOC115247348 [Takifugu rubripes]